MSSLIAYGIIAFWCTKMKEKKLPHQYSSRIQPSVNQRWWWQTFQISLKIKTENTILSIKYTLSTFKTKLNDIFSYNTDYDKNMINQRSLLFLYWTYSNFIWSIVPKYKIYIHILASKFKTYKKSFCTYWKSSLKIKWYYPRWTR